MDELANLRLLNYELSTEIERLKKENHTLSKALSKFNTAKEELREAQRDKAILADQLSQAQNRIRAHRILY